MEPSKEATPITAHVAPQLGQPSKEPNKRKPNDSALLAFLGSDRGYGTF